MRLKLYCWRPKGFGQVSFYVMARSKKGALKAVKRLIIEESSYIGDYEIKGFGTDHYVLDVLPIGVATYNTNT